MIHWVLLVGCVARVSHPLVTECSHASNIDRLDAIRHLAHVNDNNGTVADRIRDASVWIFESGVLLMRRGVEYDDNHRTWEGAIYGKTARSSL